MAPHKLKDLFGTDNLPNFPPRYNAAPMQQMPVVIRHRIGMARWGFLPHWAAEDDPALAAKMINARSETVADKPSFRDSWARGNRCLVPANGFYEWKKDTESGVNQPYFITHRHKECLAFAGLWSKAGNLVTFTVLTREADDPIASLHHRMPVMVNPAQAGTWFDATQNEALEMMKNSSAHDMVYHAVDGRVGKAANDSEELIEAVKIPRQGALAL